MSQIQGNFSSKNAAEKARRTLVEAGVSVSNVHIWNNIPDSVPFRANHDSAENGALLGGVLGGALGIAAGAAIGGSLGETDSVQQASGSVRLVLDNSETLSHIDIEEIMRASGATSIVRND